MTSYIHSVTIDCANPAPLADFWTAALGYVVEEGCIPDEEGASIVDPAGRGPRLLLEPVPEHKSVKNRVHLDLSPSESMAAEVRRLIELGARVVAEFREVTGTWTVMRDPEGNEFCVERGPRDRVGQ